MFFAVILLALKASRIINTASIRGFIEGRGRLVTAVKLLSRLVDVTETDILWILVVIKYKKA